MASETDLRELAAINCKPSSAFVVIADGSGAFFFEHERQSFFFISFENGQLTNLTMEKIQTLHGSFNAYSPALLDRRKCDSAETTNFLVVIKSNASKNVHSVLLLSANIRNKAVSIIDQLNEKFTLSMSVPPYLYKAKSGEHYAIYYDRFVEHTTLSVYKIMLNKSDKLEFQTIILELQLPGYCTLPFIQDEAVFFFHEFGELTKVPFIASNASDIPLSIIINIEQPYPEHFIFNSSPIHFNGNIYFSSCSIKDKTEIYSFNMEKLSWSHKTTISHHRLVKMRTLNILPDGSAFLLTTCGECQNSSHVIQFDLAIEWKQFFVSQNELGKGGFGDVVEGKLHDERKVAVKILHVLSASKTGRFREILLSAISEARKLKILAHNNVVTGYGFRIEEKRFLLCMELMTESVRQKILRIPEKRLKEKEAFHILQQALEGLVYLHTFKPIPIVHRDIKCANILIDENGIAKLGDLGLVKAVSLNTMGTTDLVRAPNEAVGTVYWQAPEVLAAGAAYGRKADVWSIGCSLVEMLTGYPPHCNLQPTQWAVGLQNGSLIYDPKQLINNISTNVVNILEKCFARQTKKQETDKSASHHQIRPHSWEILGEVISINELIPAQEKVNAISTKILKLFAIRQNDDD